MKGIDIVYHADNNTMELKDAPDDLLIGTDGDDYATYLKFQIIDDEGILDGFSPYVLFEVESRPMIKLDESYTLNLTQDILNKARYGKLPFMLVFRGKDSTIEIHSTNSLTLGIAHSIDADREVKDDTPDSELAIKYVEITYHAESRLMELTDMPDDQFVGTDGDDYATYLRFHMDDPDGLLAGYGARVEFDVSIKDENGDTYKPFIVIDETMSVPLIQRILSNVKYGAIPIQLAFKGTDSEGRSSQYYSLNKLRLSISDSIRAIEGIDVNDRIDLNSVINNVEYNPKTATFSFRQIDGGTIAVQLSDLSEEHFEVSTKDDLKKLNKAQNGDTATTLDDGKWYKLYGEYSDPQSWIVMSPSVKAVDGHISDRDNPHNVTKSQIGLGNVDDTSDIDKPISTLTQEALDTKADSKDLSELSKIVSEEIADRESSDSAINESISNHVSDTDNPHNVTKEQLGLENVDNTSDVNKPISTATQEALDDKADKIMVSSLSNTLTKEIQDRQAGDNTNATAISTHATNKSNPHGVTKEQVGLGNVDNTSDADKPISTATQNALNLKADKTEISALYRPKGSVATYNDLPTTAQIGDVYDVQSTGMNYVWTGSRWDELGAIIDLSPYYTKIEVDSALSGKVSKSGDTMNGTLTLYRYYPELILKTNNANVTTESAQGTGGYDYGYPIRWKANDDSERARIQYDATTSGIAEILMETWDNAHTTKAQLKAVINNTTKEKYGSAPSWSVGTNDNSDKVLTIKMANSLPSLVHSTTNETVAGIKTFSESPYINRYQASVNIQDNVKEMGVAPPQEIWNAINFMDKAKNVIGRVYHYSQTNGATGIKITTTNKVNDVNVTSTLQTLITSSGTPYATAPSTPSTAVLNEIATADWSLGKFVQKTGDKMTGDLTINSPMPVLWGKVSDFAITDTVSTWKSISSVRFQDKNGQLLGGVLSARDTDGYQRTYLASLNSDGSTIHDKTLILAVKTDGTTYVQHPSWSIGTNDNSDKSLTIKMANSLPSLLHSTGNEAVDGVKTFSSVPKISTWAQILGVPSEVGWTKVATITKSGSALNRYCALIEVHTPYHRKSGLLNIWAFGSSVFTDCGADWVYNFGYTPNEVAVHLDTSGTVSVWISQGTNRTQTMFKCVEQYGMWRLDLTSWIILDTGSREFATALPTEGTIHYSTSSKVTTPSADATGTEVVNAGWSLGKFVQKSGDTITGNLTVHSASAQFITRDTNYAVTDDLPNNYTYGWLSMNDKNGAFAGRLVTRGYTNGERRIYLELMNKDGSTTTALSLDTTANKEHYLRVPTPSSSSDNSTKTPTTAWISTADCIVHKTGNEAISGQKTFKDIMWRQISDSSAGLVMNHTKAHGSTDTYYNDIVWRDSSIYRAYIRCNLWPDGESIQLVPRNAEGGYGGEPLTVKWTSTNGMEVHVPYAPENSDGVNAVNTSWANNHFVKKSGGKVTESIAFAGQVGNTQTEAGVYLGLDTNASAPNANIAIVSANTAAYIDMGAPNEDYGFRIIKWRGVSDDLAQLCYSNANITIPRQNGTMALKSDIPTITASTTDIGEGSALATGTLYLVYE